MKNRVMVMCQPFQKPRMGQRLVGHIKVLRQGNPQHLSNAPGHVRVAAEIKVELQRVAQRHRQGRGAVEGRQIGPAPVRAAAKSLCHNDLLPNPQGEQPQALGNALGGRSFSLDRRIWGITSSWKAMGPEVTQGKKLTKQAYSSRV